VRNNMQIVLSLLDIEGPRGTEASIGNMRRRVRILARANDIAISSPAAEVELRRLVGAALSGYRLPGGESTFAPSEFSMVLDIERISSVAIALAEIGETLASIGLPVAVGLEGARGEESLVFRWKEPSARAETADAEKARMLAERLTASRVVGSIASPNAISVGEAQAEGEASISVRLAFL
jgi:hypothetical protein